MRCGREEKGGRGRKKGKEGRGEEKVASVSNELLRDEVERDDNSQSSLDPLDEQHSHGSVELPGKSKESK